MIHFQTLKDNTLVDMELQSGKLLQEGESGAQHRSRSPLVMILLSDFIYDL